MQIVAEPLLQTKFSCLQYRTIKKIITTVYEIRQISLQKEAITIIIGIAQMAPRQDGCRCHTIFMSLDYYDNNSCNNDQGCNSYHSKSLYFGIVPIISRLI